MTTLKEALDQLAKGHELDNEQKKLIIEKWQKELGIQHCEDAISRAEAVRVVSGYCHPSNIAKELAKLPSVQPKLTECEDAISRQDTLKTIIKHLGIRSEEYLLPAEEAIYKVVKNMPPVTPKLKTGHWTPKTKYWWECSECGRMIYAQTESDKLKFHAFCGRCGAKMESEDKR